MCFTPAQEVRKVAFCEQLEVYEVVCIPWNSKNRTKLINVFKILEFVFIRDLQYFIPYLMRVNYVWTF